MAANPKMHSVRLGIPSLGNANTPINKVRTYMTSVPEGQLLNPQDQLDTEQIINVELLQIISTGIDNIVIQLKARLGNNFTESNTNAGIIRERLDRLKRDIDIDIGLINATGDSLGIGTQANGYEPIIGNNYFTVRANTNPTSAFINNIDANDSFINLDEQHIGAIPNQDALYGNDDAYDQNAVENRLKNCQNLEFLYLKKHDEIMKIFAFTLNLFDKYKYAIKVVLFLLKHLVYKDPASDPPPYIPPHINQQRIRLPVTIIPNIKKLLDDQKKVQEVINKMKTVIVDPDNNANSAESRLQDLQSPVGNPSENVLNNKIGGPPIVPPRPARPPP